MGCVSRGVVRRQQRGGFLEETDQLLAELLEIGAAGAQHLGRGGIVEQRQQQVLDRHELMALLPCFLEGQVQA